MIHSKNINLIKFLFAICIPICIYSKGFSQVIKLDCCANLDPKAIIVTNATTALVNSAAAVASNNIFNFQLTESVNTSAGVYDANDVLVRTLWSGVRYDAGCYQGQWDGLMDDNITVAPYGNYTIKILQNNVKYEILGGIGNTGVFTGNVWKGFAGVGALAFTNTKGFWGEPFSEGTPSENMFNLNDLSQCYKPDIGVRAHTAAMATDGTNIYFCGTDDYGQGMNGVGQHLIFAVKAADYSPIKFNNGVVAITGQSQSTYNYYIGKRTGNGYNYSGIAVNDNFIFASCSSLNKLYVFDKISGAQLQNLTLSSPTNLVCTKNNAFIWVYESSGLHKYPIDANGSLGPAVLTLNYTGNIAFNISPTTGQIAVSDNTNSQVKFYDQNGNLTYTQGQSGGYTNGPSVTTDKFMFYDQRFVSNGAIAFQPDGSYWLSDPGNYRTLHFNADHTYSGQQFAFIPSSRSTNTDPNIPSRVFGDALEYSRDYSKPLTDPSSWYLKNNWNVGTDLNEYGRFKGAVTLSNGKTYAYGNSHLYLLDPASGSTYLKDISTNATIEADGSAYDRANNGNLNFIPTKQVLTGFDNNIPKWAAAKNIVNTPAADLASPSYYINNIRGASSNQSKYFFFNPTHHYDFGSGNKDLGYGYHLGAINTGDSNWNFLTSKSTYPAYNGPYPTNGWYDVGNSYDNGAAQHSENCLANVVGKYIFWHVNAEFWGANTGKAAEANITNLYHENGLLITNFGITADQINYLGTSQFAGNSFSTTAVNVNGDIYYNTCDESAHAAICEWKITNLTSIREQLINLTINKQILIATDLTNLMAGLPYRTSKFLGGNGWEILSPVDLNLATNVLTVTPDDVDIAIASNKNMLVRRSLNNTSSSSSWTLSGLLSYAGSQPTFGTNPTDNDIANYLEIVDKNGKIIARFIGNEADTRNNYYFRIWLNNVIVFQNQTGVNDQYYRNFSFSYNGSNLTFVYGSYPAITIKSGFEIGADLSSPAYLQVNQHTDRNMSITFSKLRFDFKK